MEEKIKMVSAASRVLSFDKEHPLAIDEEVFQDVANFIADSKTDKKTKLAMIATASKALNISRENPSLTHRQVLGKVMQELDLIIGEMNREILS